MSPDLRSGRLAACACALGLLLGACAGTAPKSTLPPVTPIMIPPAIPAAAAPELGGGTWHWLGVDGSGSVPRDRYTLDFMPDGRLVLLADCNRGSARYAQDAGGRLALTPVAATKMGCPAGSQDTVFLRQLGEVEGYRLDADGLRLQLRGGGSMRFAR